MQEDQIAAELANRLPNLGPADYSYPDESKAPPEPQPETGATPEAPEDPFQKYLTKQEVLKYFEVSGDKVREASETIDNIIAFVKREVGSGDLADIVAYLNQTERMIGSKLSSGRLAKMRQFVVIRNQRRLLEQKERALYA